MTGFRTTDSLKNPRSRRIPRLLSPFLFLGITAGALTPQDRAVRVTAEFTTPHQITLRWPTPSAAPARYDVYRRKPGEINATLLATLPGTDTEFVDADAPDGVPYEYEVRVPEYNRFGILQAGRGVPATMDRGVLLLLVDQTQAAPLAGEINRLRDDLIGDGWGVVRHDVPRDDVFASSGVLQRQVKDLILAETTARPGRVTTVFLLGRVPVPYSGRIAPDGHTNHTGAWPADIYYGELDGNWTDAYVSTDVVGRRRNMPGDGKFDQSVIPLGGGKIGVELAVGRVDFAGMTAFPLSETELLRRYLNKDHDYRWGLGDFAHWERRALMRDGFGDFSGESFAASGWRAFTGFFGIGGVTSVAADQYMPTLAANRYLWSFGCGGGTYTSAGGVGTTADFATFNPRSVFVLLFGSYFGDWDSPNNFLRAPLGTSYGLASVWAARPNWYFHRMAMGGTLGDAVRFTQERGGGSSYGERYVHPALMGDPTLKLHVVEAPANLSVSLMGDRPRLSWTASPDGAVAGYYIERRLAGESLFERVSGDAPSADVSWTDTAASPGRTYVYRVRAAKIESSPSGTYWNTSQGLLATVTLPPEIPDSATFIIDAVVVP